MSTIIAEPRDVHVWRRGVAWKGGTYEEREKRAGYVVKDTRTFSGFGTIQEAYDFAADLREKGGDEQ